MGFVISLEATPKRLLSSLNALLNAPFIISDDFLSLTILIGQSAETQHKRWLRTCVIEIKPDQTSHALCLVLMMSLREEVSFCSPDVDETKAITIKR